MLRAEKDAHALAKRRFRAIAAVLNGISRKEAARAVNVMPHTLRKWIRWFNEAGLDGLGPNHPGRWAPSDIGVDRDVSIAELRQAAKGMNEQVAIRLSAIADVLEGMSRKEAAAKNNCTPSSIQTWVNRLNAEGIEGLQTKRVGRKRSSPIRADISADDLCRAAKDMEARKRTRFLAVAYVLAGLSQEDAAKKAGVNPSSICRWIQRFNSDGMDGLRGR